jgi:poly(hydroxyalkanoate) depolymerase family esterase
MTPRGSTDPSIELGSWLAGLATGPGGLRRYYLYHPPGLRPEEGPRPLMLMLHGCGQLALDFARITRMHQLAACERFFVLYPEQDRLANPKGCWNWCERTSGLAVAEAATLMAAVDQACKRYPVDRERIAVAGLSAGASMAALIASLFPRRIKAVAMHSGVAPGAAMSAITAMAAMTGLHAPPLTFTAVGKAVRAAAAGTTLPGLMVLHGDADEVVAPGNADSTAAIWSMATGSSMGAQRTWQRAKRRAVHETDFTRVGRTHVTLCKVQGLGHAWSGGAADQPFSDGSGPCATRMFWSFAESQFQAAPT